MTTQTSYRVGPVNGIEGRSFAWVLGHPAGDKKTKPGGTGVACRLVSCPSTAWLAVGTYRAPPRRTARTG